MEASRGRGRHRSSEKSMKRVRLIVKEGYLSSVACPGRTVARAVQQGQSVDRTRRLRPSWRSFLFRFASSLLIVEPSVSEERHPAVSILRGGLELSLFRVLFIPDEAGRERRGEVEFL